MSDEPEGTPEQISRRRALKRMAAAGAVAWATPVVQTINMQRAWAENASPPRNCYRVKIEDDGSCDDGQPGANDCLTTGDFLAGGCDAVSPDLVISSGCEWIVTVNGDCVITEATAKTGNECHSIPGSGTNTITINTCEVDEQDISHVELVVCCEEQATA